MSEAEVSEQEKILRGVVKRVTYYNSQNGYSVLQLMPEAAEEVVTVVGSFPQAKVGAHLVVRGAYREHPRFGSQFTAYAITETPPSSPEGIQNYLASGLVKGIGPRTAERLTEKFGDKTLEIIVKYPEQVARLSGVGKHKAKLLQEALTSRQERDDIMRFLLEHNITQGLAARIIEKFGTRAIEVLSKDPYLLARELRGVGFSTADQIGLKLGLKPDSPQRLKAGAFFALEKASDDGHCLVPRQPLLQKAAFLLGLPDEEAHKLEPELEALVQEGYLVADGDNYYLRQLYKAEAFVSEFIAERVAPRDIPLFSEEQIQASLADAAQSLGVSFSPEQEEAVRAASNYRLLIITGGPGCGKTTIIRALSHMYADKRLALTAPTGRAAQRMGQVCERTAGTIHRLLKYNPADKGFLHGPHDPLPADVVIVDEASMIDLLLAKDLFGSIPHEATLILVGDKDQLPSVGPGKVFSDLISIKEIKTIALSRLFRRAEESSINQIAHMINSGITPEIPEPDGVTKTDAYFIPRKDPEEAARTIENLVAEQLPRKFGFRREEITVLTPSNRGELGAERLNQRIQEKLNPRTESSVDSELDINGTVLRVGDRVCQRVNNYQIDDYGVFNGDLGTVQGVDKSTGTLWIEMWDGRLLKYAGADLYQLSLAYAVTVHRSQGSEVPCVVLALHDSHYTLLERQLIYTGVTRAKKLLVIVGSKRALSIASKKMNSKRRNTLLAERIRARLDS